MYKYVGGMKMTKIVPINLGYVKAFLIIGDSLILVDTGPAGSADRIEKSLKNNGYTFQDLDLIIITHNHADHTGSLLEIKELSNAKILTHEEELSGFESKMGSEVRALTFSMKLFVKLASTNHPILKDVIIPEIVIKEEFDLSSYGIEGIVIHTPGHTNGSLSVIINNKAIIGDLIQGKMFFIKPKLFPIGSSYEIMKESLANILSFEIKTLYPSHGSSVNADEVKIIL